MISTDTIASTQTVKARDRSAEGARHQRTPNRWTERRAAELAMLSAVLANAKGSPEWPCAYRGEGTPRA
jgi:hypothetical protein